MRKLFLAVERFAQRLLRKSRHYRSNAEANETRKRAKMLSSRNGAILIDIGAGEKRTNRTDVITIDHNNCCDLNWDLLKPLPFPDCSVDVIYCSHVLEHFSCRDGDILLENCFNALKPGGKFLCSVPNAAIYIDAYLNKQELPTQNFYKPALNYLSYIDYINYMAYMDGHHHHLFDLENLLLRIQRIGFVNVKSREFEPDWDLEARRWESLYALGQKQLS